MTALDPVFAGLALVGGFLAYKVIREGSVEVRHLSGELERLQRSRLECEQQARTQAARLTETEARSKALTEQLSTLEQEQRELASRVKARHQDDEQKRPTRFRVELEE